MTFWAPDFVKHFDKFMLLQSLGDGKFNIYVRFLTGEGYDVRSQPVLVLKE